MEAVVTTGATRRAKLQIVTTNKPTPNFLQVGCPPCRPTNSVKALKESIKYNLQPEARNCWQLCV